MKKPYGLSIEEIFCGMPRLKEFFKRQDNLIKRFREENKDSSAVKEIDFMMSSLMSVATSLTPRDLKILYYLGKIPTTNKNYIVACLKKMWEDELEFDKAIGGDKNYDELKRLAEVFERLDCSF